MSAGNKSSCRNSLCKREAIVPYSTCSLACKEFIISKGICVECGTEKIDQKREICRRLTVCGDDCVLCVFTRNSIIHKRQQSLIVQKNETIDNLNRAVTRLEGRVRDLKSELSDERAGKNNSQHRRKRTPDRRRRSRERSRSRGRSRERKVYKRSRSRSRSKTSRSVAKVNATADTISPDQVYSPTREISPQRPRYQQLPQSQQRPQYQQQSIQPTGSLFPTLQSFGAPPTVDTSIGRTIVPNNTFGTQGYYIQSYQMSLPTSSLTNLMVALQKFQPQIKQ